MKITDRLAPNVQDFIEALGIKVMSLEEYFKLAPNDRDVELACYSTSLNAIALSESMNNFDLNRALLHEIGHWSGGPAQLARKHLVHLKSLLDRGVKAVYGDDAFNWDFAYHTEEVTADAVALKLARHFGYCVETYAYLHAEYASMFYLANHSKAARDSDQAFKYLMERLSAVKAA